MKTLLLLCTLPPHRYDVKKMLCSLKISKFVSFSRLMCCKVSEGGEAASMIKFKETFSRRMAMAGIKPHHRIALGVSGGADSIGLCILASGWKKDALLDTDENFGCIDGLLGVVVDHRLRPESTEEAQHVCDMVFKMGIRCQIAACDWSNGRPKQGHLQEAARDKRYEIFQDVCIKEQIGVLLVAHHADDQAELFILRLSRNSGILGLAGMPFVSQLFGSCIHCYEENSSSDGILLVRPLLDLQKEDMYKICQVARQEWVEDPTNQKDVFARNRIRMSLRKVSSGVFKSELQSVISACRKTRSYVEHICGRLIDESVTVTQEGSATIDLAKLNPSKVEDIYLSKFIALVLQFVSQRHRPVRGRISRILLNYLRSSPCKTSLTAAGCFLSAVPSSRGTKILVCCSLDSPQPSRIQASPTYLFSSQQYSPFHDVVQIILEAKSHSNFLLPNALDVPLLHLTCSHEILSEAKKLNLVSESTLKSISLLQHEESKHFSVKREQNLSQELTYDTMSSSTSVREPLRYGRFCHFMNRFLIMWKLCADIAEDASLNKFNFNRCREEFNLDKLCSSCIMHTDTEVMVRHMIENDWLYLSRLSKDDVAKGCREDVVCSISAVEPKSEKISCAKYRQLSAHKALQALKSIPVSARRGLPVLVNSSDLLLSIPTIYFDHCPCLSVVAVFKPRVPLGGGYSSYH
ncbi:hypothetical protein H6P81_000592 [Aristolochia fimbriata]|uniref:tRNA(Ile)-lysidine synthetase n=1 Tax=Aristolochia fimbriata TaxID=158543 RepID=A0AAV7F656_ARIFI|nr:hypothetical protein H6P81_000592 [Aristolochia fimbriata]